MKQAGLATRFRQSFKNDLAIMFRGFLERATQEEIQLLHRILFAWEQSDDAAAEEVPLLSAFASWLDQSRYVQVSEFELEPVVNFLRQLRSSGKRKRNFQPVGDGWLLWKRSRSAAVEPAKEARR